MAAAFKWKRFWCRREDGFSLGDQGYLSDPEGAPGLRLNPSLTTFDQINGMPCLALLGEPGIGKSWCLNEAVNFDVATALHVDLRRFGSEERLARAIFEAPDVKRWVAGGQDLHLYLDSLDECLLRIDNVAALLADELPNFPLTRLKLRVACRTASWPPLLERALSDQFGANGFGAYELVPLRKIDVALAAAASGIKEVERFLHRIDELRITAFAIKPVTLQFLIDTYLRDGDLPSRALDLYERGCSVLCEERNESRRASRRMGTLAALDRVAIASRIAAATQLGNKYAVWLGNPSTLPPEDVSLDDLGGGSEVGRRQIAITNEALLETLDTGLFSSRGPEALGWAHQTYAEFLAARYCVHHTMPVQQLRAILFHPRSGRVVPQLRETASWIALQDSTLFREIAQNDPEVLLGSAASSLSDAQRADATGALIKSCDSGEFLHVRRAVDPLLRNLSHAGLADQLGAVLKDKARSDAAKLLAVNIARRCQVHQLGRELADLALNAAAPEPLRNAAAFSVAEIADEATRLRLRPLAQEVRVGDVPDERKGAALIGLWPQLIGADELFGYLTHPPNSNLFGLYWRFVSSFVLPNLKPQDIPAALQWYARQEHEYGGSFEDLLQGILSMAVDHIEEDGIASELAAATSIRIKSRNHIEWRKTANSFEDVIATDAGKRRRLLAALLPLLGGCDLLCLIYPINLLFPEDIGWLIARIVARESPQSLELEAAAVCRLAFCWDRDALNAVWKACQETQILAQACRGLFEPVSLNLDTAKWERERESRKKRSGPAPLQPPPKERVEEQLRQAEAGNADAWLGVMLDMSLGPTSSAYTPPWQMSDMEALPGWVSADQATRARILASARKYLEESPFREYEWFPSSEIPRGVPAATNALALLYAQDRVFLETAPPAFWRPWIPALLSSPQLVEAKSAGHMSVLRLASQSSPEEFIRSLLKEIDLDSRQHGYFLCEDRVEAVWSPQLATALVGKLREGALKPNALQGLLAMLLNKGVTSAREWAENAVRAPEADPETRISIASSLLVGASDAGWSTIWPLISADAQFGRAVLERTSHIDPTNASFTQKLSDSELGDLYIWLLGQYPLSEDQTLGFGAMGPEHTIRFLRDGTLEALKRRASFVACGALAGAMIRFPEYSWLRYHFDEAEYLACAAAWDALPVRDILAAATDTSRRLVESDVQLLAVLLESLTRLQSRLHDELPAVRDLWNARHREWWPKDEEEISDYVARHFKLDLQDRGVIINREVQIRRGIPGQMRGQSTDIHVDAVKSSNASLDLYGRVSVIVEVKGSWNRGLLDDMEGQLLDRYMRSNECRSGLYLVAHFSAASWADDDARKTASGKWSVEALRDTLAAQAKSLSSRAIVESFVLDATLSATY